MKLNPWPYFSEEEINYAANILKSGKVNYWTGNEGKLFEEEFALWSNSKYGIAVANGSLALTAAYKSINLQKGDEIITTPRTFIATSSSAVLLEANPIFADIDINSGCITRETIEPLISSKTKAISVVHLGGWPADIKNICDLAKEKGLKVIEDCSQAHGAKVLDNNEWKSVGSFGDVSTWSFCQDKIMTTCGEGGMITTSDKNIKNKCWSYKDHGKTLEAINNQKHIKGFKWLHESFGSNFRLTEIQSAVGRIQIGKMKEWHKIRSYNANVFIKKLGDLNLLRVPLPNKKLIHAWYKFYCYVKPDLFKQGWSRDRVIQEINKRGYPAFSGSCSEIYLEKCFKKYLPSIKRLKNSQLLGETSLMFLLHPTITASQIEEYSNVVREVILKASI